MNIVLVTGGFDPLHSGHLDYFNKAKEYADHLVVGVNSDQWLTHKKGKPFLPLEERVDIIKHLDMVDEVLVFNDDDGTACDAIEQILKTKATNAKLYFANGGDRNLDNVPEYNAYKNHKDVSFIWNIGGSKRNSSSELLDSWKNHRTERDWGYWKVYDQLSGVKVKKLVIEPGCSLSDQRHFHRNEHWYVLQGALNVSINQGESTAYLKQHQTIKIYKQDWHRAYNPYEVPCHILEIQYGDMCVESDIERKDVNSI